MFSFFSFPAHPLSFGVPTDLRVRDRTNAIYLSYFLSVYGGPPFATRSSPRFKVSLCVYTPHTVHLSCAFLLSRVHVCTLSLAPSNMFLYFSPSLSERCSPSFSLSYLKRSGILTPLPLSFSLLIPPPRAFSSSLAFSQSLRTYACQSVCARLNRAGAVEMAGSR